jgi:glutathione S-transferase
VPLLELDDGRLLSEGAAILQYLADLVPSAGLLPAATPIERYETVRWLVYIGTELHKSFSPWLFHPEYGDAVAAIAKARILRRLPLVEQQLDGRSFLLGERFSVADAYLFAIVSWAPLVKLPLEAFPRLQAYLARVAARDSVRAARAAERDSLRAVQAEPVA